jgi:hypothetical protein
LQTVGQKVVDVRHSLPGLAGLPGLALLCFALLACLLGWKKAQSIFFLPARLGSVFVD